MCLGMPFLYTVRNHYEAMKTLIVGECTEIRGANFGIGKPKISRAVMRLHLFHVLFILCHLLVLVALKGCCSDSAIC